ncbi:MAG: hypothetical protein H7Y86_20725, partial [Rhizobacter sp.]|nr:hypothetical protein [Ferruginibacter sp.]
MLNEIKRYDQALAEQLEHLPMPSEDMAWAEMKKLLDEDDDDPAVIPFFRRPGCLLLGLVAALLLSIGGWLYFRRDAAPVPVSEQLQEDKRKERTNTGNNNPLNRNDLDKISNTILSTTTGENSQNADTTAKAGPGSLNISGEEINPGNKIKTTTPGSASINISAPGMDENKNKGRVAKRRTAASSD